MYKRQLKESGCTVLTGENSIYLRNDDRLSSVRAVRTMPYPGFPTDMQAPLMAALSCAEGSTVFVENIFENRFKHVEQLRRMGAKISVEGKVAVSYTHLDESGRILCPGFGQYL